MRHPIPALLAALTIGSAAPLQAQVPEWVAQILAAAQLPVATTEARREGVANNDIQAILDAMGRAGVPAHEATAVIDTARVAHREHGATDNFGAFVQTQLAAGKRGRDLSAAIRAEHERTGKGRGNQGRGAGQGRGKSPDAARGGRPDSVGIAQPDARGQGRGKGRGGVPVPPTR